jgi:hypothetical protein
MRKQLDIFRIDTTGNLVWRAEAKTLDLAKSRVRSLMTCRPAKYVILNKKTGYRTFVLLEGHVVRARHKYDH